MPNPTTTSNTTDKMKPSPSSLRAGDQRRKAVRILNRTRTHHDMQIHIWVRPKIKNNNLSRTITRFVEARNQECNRRGPIAERRVSWDPYIIWRRVRWTIRCLNHRFYNNHSQIKTTCIITVKTQSRSPTSQTTWMPKATQETGTPNRRSLNLQHQNSRFEIKGK